MLQHVRVRLRLKQHVLRIAVKRKLVALRTQIRKGIRKLVALKKIKLLVRVTTRRLVVLKMETRSHHVQKEIRRHHALKAAIISLAVVKESRTKSLKKKEKKLRRQQVFQNNSLMNLKEPPFCGGFFLAFRKRVYLCTSKNGMVS